MKSKWTQFVKDRLNEQFATDKSLELNQRIE